MFPWTSVNGDRWDTQYQIDLMHRSWRVNQINGPQVPYPSWKSWQVPNSVIKNRGEMHTLGKSLVNSAEEAISLGNVLSMLNPKSIASSYSGWTSLYVVSWNGTKKNAIDAIYSCHESEMSAIVSRSPRNILNNVPSPVRAFSFRIEAIWIFLFPWEIAYRKKQREGRRIL